MLCQNCNQKPASIHITQITNGEKKEMHLCEQCSVLQDTYNISFNFPSFIANFLDLGDYSQQSSEINENTNNLCVCPACGMDYDTFKKYGKFGCRVCYHTFRSHINPMIKKLHGKDQHIGKLVKHGGENLRLERELAELNAKLTKAVELEEYEDAAIYRDKIKAIKKTIEEQNSINS